MTIFARKRVLLVLSFAEKIVMIALRIDAHLRCMLPLRLLLPQLFLVRRAVLTRPDGE